MKILTTGGTGYIGSHVVVELLAQGHEVEILDNLSNSKIKVLDQSKKLLTKNLNFMKSIFVISLPPKKS